ncbi:MAG TPA: hypothetical protein VLK36_01750, partial [Gaiellaceae bacterium]|nr:hypothetical protein [Gaiellaceae bacterium]
MDVPQSDPPSAAGMATSRVGVRGLRTPRSAGIAGVAFSILFVAAFVCARVVVPADPTDAGTWLTDSRKKDVALVGLALAPFAGIAFLWFIGVVRSRIGEAEDRFFATVFLGSGLLFIALFLASLAITTGLVESASSGSSQKLADSGVWVVGRHVSESILEVALIMAGVFTTAASTIILRTGAVPRWLGLTGSVVAVVMVLEGQRAEPWVLLAFPVWVLALSLSLLAMASHRLAGPTFSPHS